MMAPMDVSIRPRSDADLAACVAALRLVHDADDYPMIWPADPVAWLTPPDLAAAWVAVLDDVPLAGHVLLLDSGLLDSGLLVSGAELDKIEGLVARREKIDNLFFLSRENFSFRPRQIVFRQIHNLLKEITSDIIIEIFR